MNNDRFQIETPARIQAAQPAFVMCPVAVQAGNGVGCPWEQIYRIAYEQAQQAARPSILERLQANLLN